MDSKSDADQPSPPVYTYSSGTTDQYQYQQPSVADGEPSYGAPSSYQPDAGPSYTSSSSSAASGYQPAYQPAYQQPEYQQPGYQQQPGPGYQQPGYQSPGPAYQQQPGPGYAPGPGYGGYQPGPGYQQGYQQQPVGYQPGLQPQMAINSESKPLLGQPGQKYGGDPESDEDKVIWESRTCDCGLGLLCCHGTNHWKISQHNVDQKHGCCLMSHDILPMSRIMDIRYQTSCGQILCCCRGSIVFETAERSNPEVVINHWGLQSVFKDVRDVWEKKQRRTRQVNLYG